MGIVLEFKKLQKKTVENTVMNSEAELNNRVEMNGTDDAKSQEIDFEAIAKKNAENSSRLLQERSEANKVVLKSYRIK